MNYRTAFYTSAITSLLLVGVAVNLACADDKLQARLNAPAVPVHALGVFACNSMYAVVVTDSKGGVEAITPSSPRAAAVLAEAKALKPEARSTVTLEAPCGRPDTSTDRR